jgi:drug/metabolite transporter (DMT)-like permease
MGLLVFLCVLWGVGQVAAKIGVSGIPPLLQAGVRSAAAALLLAAWCAARGIPLFQRDGTLAHGIVIAILFAGEFVFIFSGLLLTTASRATLFVYTAPFVVALGAHWLLPGERLHAVKVAGLACAFAGLGLAFADGLALPTRSTLLGDALEVLGAVFWGATTLAVKAYRRPISPEKTLFYQLALSSVVLLGLSVVLGEPDHVALTPLVVTALAYQVVIIAFASYLAWFWILSRYAASDMTAFTFWTPIFGVLASWVLLGEHVSRALAGAIVLVALGIYLVNRPAAARVSPRRG